MRQTARTSHLDVSDAGRHWVWPGGRAGTASATSSALEESRRVTRSLLRAGAEGPRSPWERAAGAPPPPRQLWVRKAARAPRTAQQAGRPGPALEGSEWGANPRDRVVSGLPRERLTETGTGPVFWGTWTPAPAPTFTGLLGAWVTSRPRTPRRRPGGSHPGACWVLTQDRKWHHAVSCHGAALWAAISWLWH